jgi:hypothetical protein
MTRTICPSEDYPTPNQRLPPRHLRTALPRTTERAPNPNRLTDPAMIERNDMRLHVTMPPQTDNQIPLTPSCLSYFFNFFHHFFPERN